MRSGPLSSEIYLSTPEARGVNVDDDAVREANQRFYRAFESLSLDRMDAVWSHEGMVACVHPGWPLSLGWEAVRETWRTIFANTSTMRFEVGDERVDVRGDFAWVVCTERLASQSVTGASRGAVLATNVFRREDGVWKMVHHHASPFVPRAVLHPDDEGEGDDADEDTPTTTTRKKGVLN